MTTARSLLVDPDAPGFYHCISRCVRRAWLCGIDPYDGKSYEHRRTWVEQRLLELAEIFAVGVYAYAVMSNHVHVVLRIDPTTAATWTDEEVAMRWVRLFPATLDGEPDEAGCRTKEQTLMGNADRLRTCRQRLGSLAWFMKALNEPIARRANREDACTGRFWQGRYSCQALLDDAAVLTCMSYVDLNPIRAGIADNLESSVHTSAVQRIEKVRSNPTLATTSLASINVSTATAHLPITTEDYLDLIDWSARLTRADKRGSIDAAEPPILRKLGLSEHQWHHQMLGTETRYWRAIGTAQSLIEKAAAIGQLWLKGLGSAQLLMRRQAA
jgi:REP element-mobilizing transposase RayT